MTREPTAIETMLTRRVLELEEAIRGALAMLDAARPLAATAILAQVELPPLPKEAKDGHTDG